MSDLPGPLECAACGERLASSAKRCEMCGSAVLHPGEALLERTSRKWMSPDGWLLVMLIPVAALGLVVPGLGICLGVFILWLLAISRILTKRGSRTPSTSDKLHVAAAPHPTRSREERLWRGIGFTLTVVMIFVAVLVALVTVCWHFFDLDWR